MLLADEETGRGRVEKEADLDEGRNDGFVLLQLLLGRLYLLLAVLEGLAGSKPLGSSRSRCCIHMRYYEYKNSIG